VRREYGPEVRLVVVGDGPLRSFYQKRVPREIVDDVVWAGRVNWRRPNYYTAADIHCTPCSRASFGMVLLEAMSCGRPVVASRISGFQLVMEHGRHGLMISPADDADRFAEGLLYLLDRPAERARMGREGRRTAVTTYSWTKIARQLEDYYVGLLRGGERAATS
jgi:phosphatidylinositol alpha-mannosyltransferase